MNSVELNGRPGDGWDIDWMIGFEEYPELASLFAPGVRRERLALVEDWLAPHTITCLRSLSGIMSCTYLLGLLISIHKSRERTIRFVFQTRS